MSNSLVVEIFAVGRWNGMEFRREDLNSIANAFHSLKEVHQVPLKFGHNDEQPMTDGQPALGWVVDVWVEENKLKAKFDNIPDTVYSAIENKLYRNVSVELDMGVEHKGTYYSLVLSGVALLGADIPAVNTLEDLTAFMNRSDLKATNKAVFSYDSAKTKHRRINMSDRERIEALEAQVTAQKAEIEKLVNENVAISKELSKKKADFKVFEESEKHRKKLELRANLLDTLEQMVKEHKITPSTRDEYMRDFDEAEEPKHIVFAVDKLSKAIESNPAYFGSEQARLRAKREEEESSKSADDVVLARAREYMEKHGEKDFSTAKQAVLRADSELADRYTKRGEV